MVAKQEPGGNLTLFSFLTPFGYDIWLLILGTIVLVAIIVWFFDQVSPYGNNRQGNDNTKNDFEFRNTLTNSMRTVSNKNPDLGRSWTTRFVMFGFGLFAGMFRFTSVDLGSCNNRCIHC
jgi:hypothetical protein